VTSPDRSDLASPEPAPTRWRPKLVALDIDGTLLGVDNEISPVVRDAVRQVASSAHVVLSTGRGLTGTRPVAERLGLVTPYLVCSNGAVIVRLHGENGQVDRRVEMVDLVTFDPGPVLRMVMTRLPETLVAVEELGVGYRVNAPFPPGELVGEITVEPLDRLVADPVTRVILRQPSVEVENFLDVVETIGLHEVSYYIGYTAWLDIAPKGVSKATGLAKVAERLRVPREEVLAIGDGNNDVEMLGWAGRGVAMGQATPDIQQVADAVTAAFEDDGVAVELSRWFDEVVSP
jgi:hydroxymethylpyrimidine pyrophosphatase-like HAD family hydrolase